MAKGNDLECQEWRGLSRRRASIGHWLVSVNLLKLGSCQMDDARRVGSEIQTMRNLLHCRGVCKQADLNYIMGRAMEMVRKYTVVI